MPKTINMEIADENGGFAVSMFMGIFIEIVCMLSNISNFIKNKVIIT